MKIIIKEPGKNDLEELLFIENLTKINNLGNWKINDYEKLLTEPDTKILLALYNDENAGFLVFRVLFEEAEILNICIEEKFRRLSIANTLLERSLEYLKGKKIKKIWLEVRESNSAARNFYTKAGFSISGISKKYYASPMENAVIMYLDTEL